MPPAPQPPPRPTPKQAATRALQRYEMSHSGARTPQTTVTRGLPRQVQSIQDMNDPEMRMDLGQQFGGSYNLNDGSSMTMPPFTYQRFGRTTQAPYRDEYQAQDSEYGAMDHAYGMDYAATHSPTRQYPRVAAPLEEAFSFRPSSRIERAEGYGATMPEMRTMNRGYVPPLMLQPNQNANSMSRAKSVAATQLANNMRRARPIIRERGSAYPNRLQNGMG